MKLNPATRTRILADMTLGIDPAGSTVEVSVDGQWYPAAWLGEATTGNVSVNGATVARWFQTARTTGYFRGPDASNTGVMLSLGRHSTKTRVALDGDQLVAESDPIDVTRRTFGLGMSAVALSLLGTAPEDEEGHTMSTTTPEPKKPPKDPDPTARPYDDPH